MEKCLFCGKANESIEENCNGIKLCKDCCEQSNKLKEEIEMINEDNVIEMKAEEVVDTPEQEVSDVKCEIVVGVKEDGSLYFTVGGNDTNLLIIDGLVKFAKRRMGQIWDQRDADLERARQEAEAAE